MPGYREIMEFPAFRACDYGFNADHALDRIPEMLIIKNEEQRTNGCSSVSC